MGMRDKLSSIGQKSTGFRASVAIQFASKYASVLVHLVITMVLARILTPTQYGTMSIISVFVGLFSILSNVGINAAVIQYRELSDEDLGALFTFTMVLGLGMAAAFCAVSFLVAAYYADRQYIPLMFFASLTVVFQSMNMVPNGMLIRDRKFLAVGLRTIITAVICGAVCIILALAGWGTYALVLNSVLSSAIVLFWNLIASHIPLGIRNFHSQLALVGKFSGYQFVSQVTQYLVRNLDNLLIGAVMGPTSLGLYDKAYKLAKYPIDIVPSTLNPVLKTFFSAAQGDRKQLYRQYVRVQKVLSILGAFTSVICFSCAKELILLAFGSQWNESIEPFRILSISIAFQMVNFTVFSALESLRKTDLLMRSTVLSGTVMAILLILGLSTHVLSIVAGCVSLGFVLYTVFVVYYVIHRGFEEPVITYLLRFIPELLSSLIACIFLSYISPLLPSDELVSLCIKLLTGLLIYTIPMCILRQDKYIRDVFFRDTAKSRAK